MLDQELRDLLESVRGMVKKLAVESPDFGGPIARKIEGLLDEAERALKKGDGRRAKELVDRAKQTFVLPKA